MADVRVNFDAVPAAPERYDADNERSFRAVVDSMSLDVTRALQELETAARDGLALDDEVVKLAGSQTITGAKSFTSQIKINGPVAPIVTSGPDATTTWTFDANGQKQFRFEGSGDDDNEYRIILIVTADDDDGDDDGGDFLINCYNDSAGSIGTALTIRRSDRQLTIHGDVEISGSLASEWALNTDNGIKFRGASSSPGTGNEWAAKARFGAGTNAPYIAGIQLGADPDRAGLIFHTHESSTSSDPTEAVMRLQSNSLASKETAMFLYYNDGTTRALRHVTVGADDSGGSGYSVLRVPN